MMDAASYAHGYGGFLIGAMELALPMAALREVVACTALSPLPCESPWVIGAIDLRGVAVPVVDLRRVLGLADAQGPQPNVIIMLHEGRLLGLLAGAVTGVFSAPPEALTRASQPAQGLAILAGSLRRGEGGQLVSVLSASALACLPAVPMIEDPEPARQQLASDDVAAEVVDRCVQLMLMRCGKVLFAIDAISVYATVSDPQLQASPLARGACRGVMRYGASDVPMLDLMDCCGMGEQRADKSLQGFLLRHDDGLVGLLVEQVVDVLSIDPAEVVALPAHVLPRGTLFAGTLALAEPAVPAHAAGQYLVLDGQALAGEEALRNLARASQPEGSCSRGASQAAADPGRVMVIYEALGEVATPLMQVTEILPYPAEHVLFEHMGPLLGVMTHRGRSVPIYCLRRVLGAEALLDAVPAAVLLVEDDGETAAFVVQRLLDIVTGTWEPSLPGHGTPGASARPLVQVNQGQRQRMLPLIDLVQRMRELRAHRQAA